MQTAAESKKSAKSTVLLLGTVLVAGFWLLAAAAEAPPIGEIDRGALEQAGQGVPRLGVEREISTTDADLTAA